MVPLRMNCRTTWIDSGAGNGATTVRIGGMLDPVEASTGSRSGDTLLSMRMKGATLPLSTFEVTVTVPMWGRLGVASSRLGVP